MFDPNQFLDMQTTEANDTKVVPVPVGEYAAIVEKVEARSWTSKKDPTKSGVALDILWSVEDPGVKALLERDKVTVKQGLMLDITETGGLDMGKGKNVGLGRVREATGLNAPGSPFGPSMLTGRMAKITVKHRVEGTDIYAEVGGVAKM